LYQSCILSVDDERKSGLECAHPSKKPFLLSRVVLTPGDEKYILYQSFILSVDNEEKSGFAHPCKKPFLLYLATPGNEG
jgi:hypothetical protein